APQVEPSRMATDGHMCLYDLVRRELVVGEKGTQGARVLAELVPKGVRAPGVRENAGGVLRIRVRSEMLQHLGWRGAVGDQEADGVLLLTTHLILGDPKGVSTKRGGKRKPVLEQHGEAVGFGLPE